MHEVRHATHVGMKHRKRKFNARGRACGDVEHVEMPAHWACWSELEPAEHSCCAEVQAATLCAGCSSVAWPAMAHHCPGLACCPVCSRLLCGVGILPWLDS